MAGKKDEDKGGRTDPAGPVSAEPIFCQIIIFITGAFIYIHKTYFGVPLLILFKDNVVTILEVRNYLQQLTDAE